MALSRDKYVASTEENVEKLVRKVMEGMDYDTMWQSAYQGLTSHYIDNDQCFVEDYYETFSDEDPELNGVQEEEDKIIYYHGHHSNPCVVGEIHKHQTVKRNDGSKHKGTEVIIITHDILFDEDYGDNLSDITKIWDCNVQCEVYDSRYDTDPDTCIHIPLNIGEHTDLSNQVLEQVLLNNNVEFVKFSTRKNQLTLDKFITECLDIKG